MSKAETLMALVLVVVARGRKGQQAPSFHRDANRKASNLGMFPLILTQPLRGITVPPCKNPY